MSDQLADFEQLHRDELTTEFAWYVASGISDVGEPLVLLRITRDDLSENLALTPATAEQLAAALHEASANEREEETNG